MIQKKIYKNLTSFHRLILVRLGFFGYSRRAMNARTEQSIFMDSVIAAFNGIHPIHSPGR